MRRFYFFSLILFFFLSACQASGTELPASVTPSPALTLTRTPMPSPPPSRTPTPVLTVLPLITSLPRFVGQNSPPIATPGLSREAYQLKNWSEDDALAMIRLMEGYAHDNDFLGPGRSRWSFREANTVVELAIKEMDFRFPSSPYRELADWHLAIAQGIAEKSDSDAWVLDRIESYLNEGQSPLSNAGLSEYGFGVEERFHVRNLFGDKDDVMVYRILPLSSYGSQGITFAVQGHTSGSYKVIPIFSRWDVNAADARPIEVEDHNGNQIPEIVVETQDMSGTTCFSRVLIFEWDGTRFVDLSHGKIRSSNCLDWSFGDPSSGAANMLTIHDIVSLYHTTTYRWNGSYYELIDVQITTPLDFCGWYAYLLDDWDDYHTGVSHLQSILKSWPAENATTLGKSCQDYLRFKVAQTYALHDRPDEAHAALKTVSPSSKLSSTAQVFLAQYHDKKDLYQSCQAAQETADQVYEQDQNTLSADQLQAEWLGENTQWAYASLCDFETIFPVLVQSLDKDNTNDPLPTLESNGLDVQISQQIDLNGDGVLDWLIDTEPDPTLMDLWGLLTTEAGLRAVYLTELEDLDQLDQDAFEGKTFVTPGETQDTLLLLRFGHNLDVHQVNKTETGTVDTEIFTDWDVENYTLQQTDKGLELEVLHTSPDAFSGLLSIYRWAETAHEFQLLPLYGNDIFTQGGPQEALPYLKRIADHMGQADDESIYEKPQMLYLLGLTYELTGDKTQAAAVYWQVWHDFPSSGYALMAQSKIEETP